MRVALAVGGWVAIMLTSEPAAACGETGSWVRLRIDGLTAKLQTAIVTEMRSTLATRSIEICGFDEPTSGTPLAVLEVAAEVDDISTSLTVDDGVTQKRLARSVDLGAIPPDGRALTLALALDELLRASWAELTLPVTRPIAPRPELASARSRDAPSSPPPVRRVWEVGAVFAVEHFSAGHDQLGANLIGRYSFSSRLDLLAEVGPRAGLAAHVARGTIHSSGLVFGGGIGARLLPPTVPLDVMLFLEALGERIAFEADPAPGVAARGKERAGFGALAVVGAGIAYPIFEPLRVDARIAGGVPLHPVYGLDGDDRVTGLAGVLLMGQLGIGCTL